MTSKRRSDWRRSMADETGRSEAAMRKWHRYYCASEVLIISACPRSSSRVPCHHACRSRVRKMLFGSGLYPSNGAHSTNPWRLYNATAGWKYAHDPVSRLNFVIPLWRAASTMCCSTADPMPRRRAVSAVCIDLTSPWVFDRRFIAPTASRFPSSHADQKETSGAIRPDISSA